jgi:hypothetical protein
VGRKLVPLEQGTGNVGFSLLQFLEGFSTLLCQLKAKKKEDSDTLQDPRVDTW